VRTRADAHRSIDGAPAHHLELLLPVRPMYGEQFVHHRQRRGELMLTILRVALATPATLDADAYREFCWGTGLERTDTGYGLLLAFGDDTWEEGTAVVDDVEYERLLTEISGVAVPADTVIRFLRDWPDLRPESDTVWP
jgi:hypothetical protein